MKGFDFERFCIDHGIDFRVGGEHHHVTENWIGVDCPWCKTEGKFHLGFHPPTAVMSCWVCGRHTLKEYLRENFPESWRRIFREYTTNAIVSTQPPKKVEPESVDWPPGTMERLLHPHREYLEKRGFDPDEIQTLFHIRATSGVSTDVWKWRILVPVFQGGKLVAIQGRDITGRRKSRYRSLGNVKNFLYNIDNIHHRRVVVVEGVFDVWRIGVEYAVATFGTTVSKKQIERLLEFEYIFIIFDGDEPGQKAAESLEATIETMGGRAESIYCRTDPAELGEYEIKTIRRLICGH